MYTVVIRKNHMASAIDRKETAKMKNMIRLFTATLLVTAMLMSFAAPAAAQTTTYISQDAAKRAALVHAGVAEANAKFVRVKLDKRERIPEYEVEFYVDNREYDYEINALTGDILSYDLDAEYYTPKTASTPSAGPITKTKAKEIALAHAELAARDVKRLRVKQDLDDGRKIYEVEFRKGRIEYSYDIDAATGTILEYDIDND